MTCIFSPMPGFSPVQHTRPPERPGAKMPPPCKVPYLSGPVLFQVEDPTHGSRRSPSRNRRHAKADMSWAEGGFGEGVRGGWRQAPDKIDHDCDNSTTGDPNQKE